MQRTAGITGAIVLDAWSACTCTGATSIDIHPERTRGDDETGVGKSSISTKVRSGQ